MRYRSSIHGVTLVLLLVTLFPLISYAPLILQDSQVRDDIEYIPFNYVSEGNSDANLTWTSRMQQFPQLLENGSTAVGDHVVLNATWNHQISGGNVTSTTLKITDGFTFTVTRPLLPGGGGFELPFEEMDWIEITGISIGDAVIITAYSEGDCDYFAFNGSIPIESYSYESNLLDAQMVTTTNPERGNITWSSSSPTMLLGCWNYDDLVGNYSVVIEVGAKEINSTSGNGILFDTYWLDSHNDTYEIIVIAETDLNESFSFKFENITICNFFVPILTSASVMELPDDELSFNISWTSIDTNSDDVHYYEIWLSNNDGLSYLLLETNITKAWFIWNSSGWLEDTYIARIRAYSVDFSSIECRLDDPPDSYWPGDYSDITTYSIYGGDVPGLGPIPDYSISTNNSIYEFGSTDNVIAVAFSFYGRPPPSSIEYSVLDNRSLWVQGMYIPESSQGSFTINIDGLSIGVHDLSIILPFGLDNPQSLTIIVTIPPLSNTTPNSTLQNWSSLVQALAVGISVGSIAIIFVMIILSIRLKRNRVVE